MTRTELKNCRFMIIFQLAVNKIFSPMRTREKLLIICRSFHFIYLIALTLFMGGREGRDDEKKLFR